MSPFVDRTLGGWQRPQMRTRERICAAWLQPTSPSPDWLQMTSPCFVWLYCFTLLWFQLASPHFAWLQLTSPCFLLASSSFTWLHFPSIRFIHLYSSSFIWLHIASSTFIRTPSIVEYLILSEATTQASFALRQFLRSALGMLSKLHKEPTSWPRHWIWHSSQHGSMSPINNPLW